MIPTGTRLEVDLAALAHNFQYLKSKISENTLFMSVIKANAYGHGMVRIAEKLQELGTDYFAVAYVEEAIELREAGITKPILVLHPQLHTLEDCFEHCIEPVIYSVKVLERFSAFAKAKSLQDYPIHLEFNTGLNRIGIDPEDLPKVIALLQRNSQINVRGLQSHLAASEDHDEKEFTQSQISKFEELCDIVEQQLGYKCLRHTDNTSGILNYSDSHYSMVRSGIGLYGYGNDINYDIHLRPVASLKSNISQIRSIKKGESVSYNRSHKAEKDLKYAVIALGHGDGINRIYGYGRANMLVNGKWAPTLGIICMDMFMVDVSSIECAVGDPVTIFDQNYPARDMAEKAGTISYELLTGIQKRVRRVYLNK
ncbi:alanine racemase [Nonlabens marinus]|uniref:Alanine racemase n=1 Tax=Nonlabens marinus S1-08 TaxID=1454201 RepID=W8VQ17_9FLAO|nr:alanine racemase [Nonlabens marinus]BAO54790.1 alanine racemase [Nonlabens marinus S1-08]